MTPQEIITTVRQVISDTRETYRYSNELLLNYVNDGIRFIAAKRPEIYSTIATYNCTPDKCDQKLSFADAELLIDVLSLQDGTSLTVFDYASMTLFNPQWRADAAAPASQWSKIENDPCGFYIYPKSPNPQVLYVRYVRRPSAYAIGAEISDLPLTLQQALADYVIYMVEASDDEHVGNGRAGQFLTSFLNKIGAAQ